MRHPGPLHHRRGTNHRLKNQTHHPRPIPSAKVLLCGYLGLQDRPRSRLSPHRAVGSVSWDLLRERWGAQGSRTGAQHRSGGSSGSFFCLGLQASAAQVCPGGTRPLLEPHAKSTVAKPFSADESQTTAQTVPLRCYSTPSPSSPELCWLPEDR